LQTVSGEITIPVNITSIGESAFHNCENLKSVSLPNGVTEIGKGAFYHCYELTSINLPEGLTTIGEGAFEWTAIADLKLPSTLTTIGWEAFSLCNNLTEVIIPNSVTELGEAAFSDCENLADVTLSESLTALNRYLFCSCKKLTAIKIPESVLYIYNSAFSNTGLTALHIPKNVELLDQSAFFYLPLEQITVDADNVTYDSREGCNAIIESASNTMLLGCKNTVFPTTITAIGNSAFEGCDGLQSVVIPEGVTEIGTGAFHSCYDLETVSLPTTLTSIGNYAFYCYENEYDENIRKGSLKSVTALMTNPFDIDDNTFYHYDTAKLYVPEGTEDLYKAHNGWCLFCGIATDIRTLTDKTAVNTAVYDLGGRLINGNQSHRGVSIVKMSNGAVRKMLQK
jgi:hypothetical protein